MVSEHYASKYHGDFGPVSEDDIVRANHGPDDVVRHAHTEDPDSEGYVPNSAVIHEHAGGAEQHTH